MRIPLFVSLLILSSGFLLQGGDQDCPAYPASKWSFNPENLENQARSMGIMTLKLASAVPDKGFTAALTRQNFVEIAEQLRHDDRPRIRERLLPPRDTHQRSPPLITEQFEDGARKRFDVVPCGSELKQAGAFDR